MFSSRPSQPVNQLTEILKAYKINKIWLATFQNETRFYFLYQAAEALSLFEKQKCKIELGRVWNIPADDICFDDKESYHSEFISKHFKILVDCISLNNDEIRKFYESILPLHKIFHTPNAINRLI